MTKRKLFLIPILLLITIVSLSAQTTPAYLNPLLPLNKRVGDLISRMTLQEKVSQMLNATPAIPRLHIPAYNWWSEALHGVARAGAATVFPQAIGLGATFDVRLEKQVASAISDEGRALYNAAIAKGYHEQYSGLTFWSPNINIFRDPRWGRGQETFGEDPFLTACMGTAFVKGMQGDDPRYLKVAACAKHFAAYSGPEKNRAGFNATPTRHDLYATYLPAFKALVNAGVAGVMCAYNAVDGEPCCANTFLLDDMLRSKWGFRGYVTSDCGAIAGIYQSHHYKSDALHAAAVALKRGVNLSCGDTYLNLIQAVQKGVVTSGELDSSLAVLLRIRFRLGMFDPKGSDPYDKIPISVVNSSAHRALAKKAALESVVLLKNDGVLPLKSDLPEYFVTGPNAADIVPLLGNYYGVNKNMVTMLEGVAADIAPASQLRFSQNIRLEGPNASPLGRTSGKARQTDATIVVLGLSGLLQGEEGDAILSPTGDRLTYNLPQNQIDYLHTLRRNNKKPIIAVITGGSPMNLAAVDSLADAVLLAWYPGEEGGAAVADLIFGRASPSGKLPVTFPMSYKQLPAFDDYTMQGRTYRYMAGLPLYPFGFGLSYARFHFSDMKISASRIRKDQDLTVTAMLTNSGKYAGTEVVQLYISDRSGEKGVPFFNLKGFQRVALKPGESRQVAFKITPSMLAVVDENGQRVVNAGRHKIYIAAAVPVPRSAALGSPEPVSAAVEVK